MRTFVYFKSVFMENNFWTIENNWHTNFAKLIKEDYELSL